MDLRSFRLDIRHRNRRWFGWRRLTLVAHRWLGLTFGIYLAMMGISGSLLVFADEIDHALNPKLLQVEPQGDRLPFSAIMAEFRAAHPTSNISRVSVPQEPQDAYEFRTGGFAEGGQQIFISPYDARILGRRSLTGSFVGFLSYLHFYLLLGDLGWALNGYGGLAAILLLVSGMIIWIPRSVRQLGARLRVKWRAARARVLWDLHSASGAWSLPLLLVITLTGAAFAFRGPLTWLLTPADDHSAEVAGRTNWPALPASAGTDGFDVDELLYLADQAVPEAKTFRIAQPDDPDKPLLVYKAPPAGVRWGSRITISIDRDRGKILFIDDSRDSLATQVNRTLYPIHSGRFGGLLVRGLFSLLGWVPAILLVTGTWIWVRRR